MADFDREAVAALLRRYAIALRLGAAEAVVALTDGGAGLEAALRRCFGAVEFVLDFWHACEHLYAFAWLWHGRDSPAGRRWGPGGRRAGGATTGAFGASARARPAGAADAIDRRGRSFTLE